MNVPAIQNEAIASLLSKAWEWLQPKVSTVGNFGDYVFFRYVLQRLEHDVEALGSTLLGNVMQFVSFVAITVVTLWVLLQGYKVVTGQLRESMMGMVANMTKTVFIVAVALSFGAANDRITRFLTEDMKDGIHGLVTGNPGSPEDEIDTNLGWLQVAMSSLDVLESANNQDVAQEKDRAITLIQLGTGGPPIVAGTLLLMYQVAMALFIGLGPIFILCLLFESTKSMFMRWLMYGIGTMFSMALLSAMVSIALGMVSDLAIALWASDALTTLFLPGADGVSSFTSRALQSGAMGMILTLLLITVPPLAANFFGGTLGHFAWGSAFGASAAATAGPNGQAPGTPGYFPTQPGTVQSQVPDDGSRRAGDFRAAQTGPQTGRLGGQPVVEPGVRQGSQLPGRETSPNHSSSSASPAGGGQVNSPSPQTSGATTQSPPLLNVRGPRDI